MTRSLPLLLPLLSILLPVSSWGASAPAPVGTGGAVSSADPLATAAGLEILRSGGNAVDAAVATALALAVVYPEAGNLGGGGFAVVRMGGDFTTLDFREVGPARARRDMYLDAEGKPVENASLVGPLAAGVPGSPAGLHELQRRFGRLPWTKVVEPARRLAAEGFPVSRYLHDLLGKEEHRKLLLRFPETARVWLPDGPNHHEPPAVGSVLKLPDLAATLDRYAKQGPKGITEGPVAAAVEKASNEHGGVLTAADLAAYKPVWRTPLTFDAFGWKLVSMPLPSSGGVILGQSLGLLERLGWGKLPRFGADRDHLLAETLRRSFADRFLLADPSTTQATEAQLLASDWLDRRAREIDPQRAVPSTQVKPWQPGMDADAAATAGAAGSSETTHLSVVDRDGNLVALTTTLNGLFGCGLWVPGAGFFLNNEMDDFAAAPGRPNLFGLIQGEANAVAPGKRMLSSMSPVIAWKGKEAYALGGRGGSRIPTHTLQVLLNLLVDGDPLQAALDRPRLHHQWLPDRLDAEPDALSPETRAELERRGHKVEASVVTAKVHAVHLLPDGRVEAASDPRGSGVGGVVDPEH
jgi:gamma-glutamyltranspeptidase/glutathione hydrolase